MPALASGREQVLILLVDDDECFRRAMAIGLRLEGYSVVEACSGHEAVACAREQSFDMAVVSQWLGPERGEPVLEEIGRLQPDAQLVSTCGQPGIHSSLVSQGRAKRLDKPAQVADLLALL